MNNPHSCEGEFYEKNKNAKKMNAEKEGADFVNFYGSSFPAESIKIIAESMGISNLNDDVATELSEDVTTKIKSVIQDAVKFMNHSKRTEMLTGDIQSALKVRNNEPLFGFSKPDIMPFCFASGGGRELYTNEDTEINLNELPSNLEAKMPPEVTLRPHWLAIDGEQPKIPENPPQVSKVELEIEAVNPLSALEISEPMKTCEGPVIGKPTKLRNSEVVVVKQLAIHELSVEQQLYYREITEACVGTDETIRAEALQSLAADPGLHGMLPRVCTFISEGVKVNAVQKNLAMLIYLIRMVKAVIDNPHLYIERYLHELIPAVTTCIVSKQLCVRPEVDNHWALRDFAARLMSRICKSFNTTTNCLQARITRVFSTALENDEITLTQIYGAFIGFSELGPDVVRIFILPRLKYISDRIEAKVYNQSRNNVDKESADRIRTAATKYCTPLLLQMRSAPDFVEEYRTLYGTYLGHTLFLAIARARNESGIELPSTSAASTSSFHRWGMNSRHGAIPKYHLWNASTEFNECVVFDDTTVHMNE